MSRRLYWFQSGQNSKTLCYKCHICGSILPQLSLVKELRLQIVTELYKFSAFDYGLWLMLPCAIISSNSWREKNISFQCLHYLLARYAASCSSFWEWNRNWWVLVVYVKSIREGDKFSYHFLKVGVAKVCLPTKNEIVIIHKIPLLHNGPEKLKKSWNQINQFHE